MSENTDTTTNANTPKTLEGSCYSCMMPFKKDPLGANREDEKNCSYCYHDGKLAYEGNDVKEFKNKMYESIVSRGESKMLAKIYCFMAGFAPRWKSK